jgi:putative tryptophan/tyrosine transport system substrate-binding protein
VKIGIRQEALGNSKKAKAIGFTVCALLFALCFPAEAQQTGKIFRVGFLDNSTASGNAPLLEAFRQEMRKLGWIERKNFTFEYRFAEGKFDRLPDLAADLVRLKVDLIMVSGGLPALAAKSATTTIPIVMANAGDPVASVWLPVSGGREAMSPGCRV